MIVVRAFGVMDSFTVQLSRHSRCCRTGLCDQADQVCYASPCESDDKEGEVVRPLAVVIHALLSAQGDHWTSDALENHLVH